VTPAPPASDLPAAVWRCLRDLVDHTDQAARLVARGRQVYQRDEMLQLAAESLFVRMGEIAARAARAAPAVQDQHPDLALRRLIDVRNVVSHGYAIIDSAQLWFILENDLPPVADAAARLLEQAPHGD